MRGTRFTPVILTAAVLLCLVLPPAALAAPVTAAEWTYVTQAPLGLRMHSDAGLLADITLVLYNGEDVRVQGDPVLMDGLWWSEVRVQRRAGEFTGWVASSYLANYVEPAAAEDSVAGYTVKPANGLRLRAQPGFGGAVLYIVPQGTQLVATDASTRQVGGLVWRQFSLDDDVVWAADYLLKAPAEAAAE